MATSATLSHSSAASIQLPETPVAGAGRYDAHLQPVRSFIRCLISAQAHGLQKIEYLSNKYLLNPERMDESQYQRLYARTMDAVAARTAYAKWKTAMSLNWGHLGPEEELLAFKEMLAVTIKHDLQLEQLCCMAIPVMAQLHAAILARNATRDGLASRMQEESAVMQLHAAQARVTELCRTLYRQLQELIALEKEALTFDSTRLLPWASKIFDKKLSEHALQVLLFGDIMPLREAASVSRWTLRNQSDPRSKQRFKAALAGGLGFERAQDLLRFGREDFDETAGTTGPRAKPSPSSGGAAAAGGTGAGSANHHHAISAFPRITSTPRGGGGGGGGASSGGSGSGEDSASQLHLKSVRPPRPHKAGAGGRKGAFAPAHGPLADIAEDHGAEEEEEEEEEDDEDSISGLRVGGGSVQADDDDVRAEAEEEQSEEELAITQDDLSAGARSPAKDEEGEGELRYLQQTALAPGLDSRPVATAATAAAVVGGMRLGQQLQLPTSQQAFPHGPLVRKPTPVIHSESPSPYVSGAAGGSGKLTPSDEGIMRAVSGGSTASEGSEGGLETPTEGSGGGSGYNRQMSEDIYSPKHLKWEEKTAAEHDAADRFKHADDVTSSSHGADGGAAVAAAAAGTVRPPRPPPPLFGVTHIQPSLSERMAQFRVGGVASHTLAITHSSSGEEEEESSPSFHLPAQPVIPGLGVAGSASPIEEGYSDESGGSPHVTESCGEGRTSLTSAAAVGGAAAAAAAASPPLSARKRGRKGTLAGAASPSVPGVQSPVPPPPHAAMRGVSETPSSSAGKKTPWFKRIFRRSETHPVQRETSPLLGGSNHSPAPPHSFDQRVFAPKPHARVQFPSDVSQLETIIPTPTAPAVSATTMAEEQAHGGSGRDMHGHVIRPGPESTGVGAGGGTELPAMGKGEVPTEQQLLALAGPITRHDLEQPLLGRHETPTATAEASVGAVPSPLQLGAPLAPIHQQASAQPVPARPTAWCAACLKAIRGGK